VRDWSDPFVAGIYMGYPTFHVDAESRLLAVRKFSVEQCRAALRPDCCADILPLQITVRRAIEARLKKLLKSQEGKTK
jgi:hypothetical protein